jgi:hypothetical protein
MEQSSALEPSARLRQNFENVLKQEAAASQKRSSVLFQPAFYRIAAALALLILGTGIGYWINKNNEQNEALVRIEQEMIIARKQLAETKEVMMGMLGNEQSASQRIKGVNVAFVLSDPDDEIVKALVNTMNTDPNTNVRLAALEALAKFREDPLVKKVLIGALAKQKDPIVQITLIQLMVQMKEKEVVKDLEKIVDEEGTLQAVKDEAYNGILKLS